MQKFSVDSNSASLESFLVLGGGSATASLPKKHLHPFTFGGEGEGLPHQPKTHPKSAENPWNFFWPGLRPDTSFTPALWQGVQIHPLTSKNIPREPHQ